MNWTRINCGVMLADAVGMTLLGVRVQPASFAAPLLACAVLFGLRAVYTHWRPDERIREAAEQTLVLVIFTHAAAVLSYLIVATNASLVDEAYARMDAWLGFDWPTWFAYVRSHHLLADILALVYASGLPQIAFVILFLSFTGRLAEVRVFSSTLALSSLLTIALSGVMPAAGAFVHYGADGVDLSVQSHFDLLRQHQLADIDLTSMQGLISMPSYHAVMSVLLAYAVRTSRPIALLLVPLNVLVLLSTLSEGGHYLVDVLGGIAVAAFAIAATGWWQRRSAQAACRGTATIGIGPSVDYEA